MRLALSVIIRFLWVTPFVQDAELVVLREVIILQASVLKNLAGDFLGEQGALPPVPPASGGIPRVQFLGALNREQGGPQANALVVFAGHRPVRGARLQLKCKPAPERVAGAVLALEDSVPRVRTADWD